MRLVAQAYFHDNKPHVAHSKFNVLARLQQVWPILHQFDELSVYKFADVER